MKKRQCAWPLRLALITIVTCVVVVGIGAFTTHTTTAAPRVVSSRCLHGLVQDSRRGSCSSSLLLDPTRIGWEALSGRKFDKQQGSSPSSSSSSALLMGGNVFDDIQKFFSGSSGDDDGGSNNKDDDDADNGIDSESRIATIPGKLSNIESFFCGFI